MTMAKRPIGVTILAIFSGILGLGVLGTCAWLFEIYSSTRSVLIVSIASAFTVVSLLGLAVSYGLWKGLFWARWLAIIGISLRIFELSYVFALLWDSSTDLFSMSTIVPAGLGLAVIAIDISAVLYLTRPFVETFFDDHETRLDYLALVLLPIPFACVPCILILAPFNLLGGFCFCIIGLISGFTEFALTSYLARD